jgi:Tol biopolymer transport system component
MKGSGAMADKKRWDRQLLDGQVAQVRVYDLATGTSTVVFEDREIAVEAPNWTNDGQWLIINGDGFIRRLPATGGEPQIIPKGNLDQANNDHVLSPDGTSIAVSHHTAEDEQSRIYVLPLAGGEPSLITPIAPSYLHGWSPDGKTLAYCAERNGQYDIYTIPVTGGRETQLTNEKGLDDGPEYSPDGKHIWFNSTRSGLMQIWRMDADGAHPTQMTFYESNNWFGHVSPNGKQVAFISYKKGDVAPDKHPPNKNVELRLMNADGGPSKPIAELFGGQGTMNVNSWAPDNKTIAFVSYRLKK